MMSQGLNYRAHGRTRVISISIFLSSLERVHERSLPKWSRIFGKCQKSCQTKKALKNPVMPVINGVKFP